MCFLYFTMLSIVNNNLITSDKYNLYKQFSLRGNVAPPQGTFLNIWCQFWLSHLDKEG